LLNDERPIFAIRPFNQRDKSIYHRTTVNGHFPIDGKAKAPRMPHASGGPTP
jgi:hypothetical protein